MLAGIDIRDVLTAVLMALGCFFMLTGGVGSLRMPDFHTRMHPAAKGDTMGQVLVLVGLMLQLGLSLATLKLALVMLLLSITAPTATHAMARAAHLAGIRPLQADGDDE